MGCLNVVHALIIRNNRFLLGKRSSSKETGAGYWATIGGRVEPGESLEAGLVRECSEEIGVQVRPLKKVMSIEECEAHHHWYEVEVVSGEPYLACEENSELKWVTVEEMGELSPLTKEDFKIIRSNY